MSHSDERNSVKNVMHLPNELLLHVFSYMNIVDICQAFYGQNERFNKLLYACARYIEIPSSTTISWLEEFMPQFELNVEQISLDDQFLERIFNDQWSFSNLRFIHLRGSRWSMSLRFQNESPASVLAASFDALREVNFLRESFFNNTLNDNDINSSNTVLCPFIKRLSIQYCIMRDILIILTRTPELTHLKVTPFQFNMPIFDTFNVNIPRTNLIVLNIKSDMAQFDLLARIIRSCETSLKRLILDICCWGSINGSDLERTFKPCEQLEKLEFFVTCNQENTSIYDCMHSFQSAWWLDSCRPPVCIQHRNGNNNKVMTSMPCRFNFAFKNNLDNWHTNKADQNSPLFRFSNVRDIHLTNTADKPISLEYLYSLDRIFTSPGQTLQFTYCDLQSEEIIFYMLTEDTSMTPVLPNVDRFIVNSSNKPSASMLCVWILLMPNLNRLDIPIMTDFDMIELAQEFIDQLENEPRLKANFDRITKLTLFRIDDHNEDKLQTVMEVSMAFKNVFRNAEIC